MSSRVVRIARWVLWVGLTTIVTVLLVRERGDIDQVHVVLMYLLIVLGGSASGGRPLGILLACAASILIDYYFQPPFDAFGVGKPLDWLTLVSFLITAVVATHLLAQARKEATHAEALREANRLQEILLASVSHDLRTPLTTIRALAESTALQGNESGAAIAEQAARLERLVNDLLDLSRLKGGGYSVQPEINTAEDLIGAAVRQAQGLIGQHPLRTVVDLSSPALVGHFDFAQSLRALGNLVENAIRHSPADAPIELGAHREGEMLVFTVADRGPGVAAADVDRIFEPFFRAAGAAPDAGRAGLGLSIARTLTSIQGGDVRYVSRPGGGSVFTIRLPATDVRIDAYAGDSESTANQFLAKS